MRMHAGHYLADLMSDGIAILGMHRSGTSFLASLLERSGVHIGSALLTEDWSNPAGHFENLDFLNFHEALLQAHGVDYLVDHDVHWQFTEAHDARAQALAAQHRSRPLWGWKDPRTCLFLEFWRTILPEMRSIAIYRHYLPVIQSLLTREYYRFLSQQSRFLKPIGKWLFERRHLRTLTHAFLRTWMHYNQMILREMLAHPSHTFVLSFDWLVESETLPYAELASMGFDLQPVSSSARQGYMAERAVVFPLAIDQELEAAATHIWEGLQGAAGVYRAKPVEQA